jgi:hypothetical protein
MAVEQVKADAKVAQERQDSLDTIAKEQQKLGAIAKDVSESIAKQQEKVAEARRDWSQVEPAVRYGYGAQLEFPNTADWDSTFESRLRNGWNDLKSGSTWEQSRSDVRHGWDSARRTNHS